MATTWDHSCLQW